MNHEKRIIALEGALNARELGGLPLKNGRKVKSGKLIRTGRLSNITEADCKLLREHWNVTTIVDLRNKQEISERPNVILEGSEFHHIGILAGELDGVSRVENGMSIIDRAIVRARNLHNNGGAGKLLENIYGEIAETPYCMDRIHDLFELLLCQKDGALIWHCTSGKDRTGITGALMLYALGADMETIKEDYLYTNIQNQEHREHLLHEMRECGAEEELVEEMRVLESVEWKYVDNFFRILESNFGSIDRFLEDRIGLTSEKREQLLNLYTETL